MAEASFQPNWFSKPGDTLAALMSKRDLSPTMLAQRMGRDAALIKGILAGTVAINSDIATLLSQNVGGSPDFWRKRQAQFDHSVDRLAQSIAMDRAKTWLKHLPIKDMVESGWISASKEVHKTFRESLIYFDVTGPDEWQERYSSLESAFSFRASAAFESKLGALAAWLRQGEIQADVTKCAPWNAEKFRTCLSEIRVLTKAKNPGYFIPRLQALCADAGVAVVFVRAPAGCRASGATRFLAPSKAMMILSFRHLSEDHFWFTFFHEAGHLLLHSGDGTFIEGEGDSRSEKEAEANEFSASMLVPFERRDELLSLRPRSHQVIRFALSVGVSPGIIVGQMQRYGLIAHNQLSFLKRRYDWAQILSALS